MYLYKDLHSIFGELLVEEGVEITPETINRVRSLGDSHKEVLVQVSNTDIFKDFKSALHDKRYSTMFDPPVSREQIYDVGGSIKLENDLIFELNNIKGNLPYTYHHIMIVTALSIKLALLRMDSAYDINTIAHCGFTHDIGKTRIPIALLNKTERLTKEERVVIESHTIVGYLLLNYYLKSDRDSCSMAHLAHHEKLDGSGYPNGTARVDKYSQLLSIVDILDALYAERPYRRKSFSLRASLDYLLYESLAGRLNKDIALTLIAIARKTKPDIGAIKVSTVPREALPEEMTHDQFK